jgi:hypothetical protein
MNFPCGFFKGMPEFTAPDKDFSVCCPFLMIGNTGENFGSGMRKELTRQNIRVILKNTEKIL